MKKALITGLGQDGSYLAELLLKKKYEVHVLLRRNSTHNPPFDIDVNCIHLHYCDLTEEINLFNVIKSVEPDELYHLAAQSDVKLSFEQPVYTSDVNALGTLRILEAIRVLGYDTRVYNAATSELYGTVNADVSLNEESSFHPESPYAFSKLMAYWSCRNYRKAYGMFICNGILFNHESPRRGCNFVTRKITSSIAEKKELVLGNMDSVRDWGYAPEYVEAMWMMLQLKKPEDFVIATGETHSVREFVDLAMDIAGYHVPVHVSDMFKRPSDVVHLCGDASKAREVLWWEPQVRFKELVRIMMEADLYGRM